jgi:hypothetical protein
MIRIQHAAGRGALAVGTMFVSLLATLLLVAPQAPAAPAGPSAPTVTSRTADHPHFTKRQRKQIKRIERLALASDNFTASFRRTVRHNKGRIVFTGVGPANHKVHKAIVQARKRTALKVRWNPHAKYTRAQQVEAQGTLRADSRIVRTGRSPWGCVGVQPNTANYAAMQAMSRSALRAELGVTVCVYVTRFDVAPA